MGICHLEQEIVDQNFQVDAAQLWMLLQNYLADEAVKQPLHGVEEGILRRLLDIGKSLLQQFVTHRASIDQRKSLQHEGEALLYHGMKSCSYLSIFGRIDIVRAYYWKRGYGGICPLDAELALPQRCYSYLLIKWAEKGIANSTYDEAITTINDILGLKLSKGGLETLAKEVSDFVSMFYETRSEPKDEGSMLVGSVDCKGVSMVPAERPESTKQKESISKVRREKGDRKKGLRRDAVVTADYSIDLSPRTPEAMIEALMQPLKRKPEKVIPLTEIKMVEERKPKNKQVLACMFGKEKAIRELMDRIKRRDLSESKPIYLLIDGAMSLESGLREEIKKRGWEKRLQGFCLDIIHVMEYVWNAGTALYGEQSKDREKWVRKEGLALLRGDVGRVIGGLRQILTKRQDLRQSSRDTLEQVIMYFENHRHMLGFHKKMI